MECVSPVSIKEASVLVLTRREGEAIVVPRALIRVTVTRIDGNRVKLGVESPHGYEVYREELLEHSRNETYQRTKSERIEDDIYND